MNFAKSWPDYLLPIGIIACLMVIFVPLPPMVMDVMLAANISIAVIILLATVYAKSPLELSVFPSLLLVTTLARLALNVGTTRLILTRGAIDGDQAAGGVIQGFSQFVAGDSLAIGFVIFSIILVIQFVVITKGASRISEVAARFTLDGMPGRQLAIDADLNAGVIDNEEAQLQRRNVIAQADFYGTMDGASKFVRGDAIAGAIITMINIAGGLVIGLSAGMTLAEAGTTFTRLTIGDGLVSQLPALLISLAAGLLVTRSTQPNRPVAGVRQTSFCSPCRVGHHGDFPRFDGGNELAKNPVVDNRRRLFGRSLRFAAAAQKTTRKQTYRRDRQTSQSASSTGSLGCSLDRKVARQRRRRNAIGHGADSPGRPRQWWSFDGANHSHSEVRCQPNWHCATQGATERRHAFGCKSV